MTPVPCASAAKAAARVSAHELQAPAARAGLNRADGDVASSRRYGSRPRQREAVDAGDCAQGAQLREVCERRAITRCTDIEVGRQRRLQPLVQARAKARDHQPDAVDGGNGDGERRRRDTGAAQRCVDAANRQRDRDASSAVQQAVERAHQQNRRQRRQQRAGCEHAEQAREGGMDLTRTEREQQAAGREERHGGIGRTSRRGMRAPLEHGSTQRGGGCNARGVQRRFGGRDQRRDEARALRPARRSTAMDQRRRRQR